MLNKLLHKKNFLLLLIAFMALLQGGCWSMVELTDRAIVLAAGIDRTEDNNILLTVQIARPGSFGGEPAASTGFQNNNVWVVSATGDTVLDARRQLEQKVSRMVYFGHTSVLLVGEEMAKHDLRQAIDFLPAQP